jgi:hypothetical protein
LNLPVFPGFNQDILACDYPDLTKFLVILKKKDNNMDSGLIAPALVENDDKLPTNGNFFILIIPYGCMVMRKTLIER